MRSAAQVLALYRFDENGQRPTTSPTGPSTSSRSTTNPAARQQSRPITKEAIFHYVYGVLHDPVYREKYALEPEARVPAHSVLRRASGSGPTGARR